MTFEDIRRAALARVQVFTDKFPTGKDVPYRRIGVRQQELYELAAEENDEYAGAAATADVIAGAVNFRAMTNPVSLPSRIARIEIASLEAGAPDEYAVGQEITVIGVNDIEQMDGIGARPRATLRDWVLRQVGTDFEGIAEILVYYPFLPDPAEVDESGDRDVDMPGPHDELLVIDLTLNYLRQAIQLDNKAAILELLQQEEVERLARWRRHAAEFAPIQSPFRVPQHARTRRI